MGNGIELTPDGDLQIQSLEGVPAGAWQNISDYMSERGYDWRGAEDAKAIFERLRGRTGGLLEAKVFPDHVAAMSRALGMGKAVRRKRERNVGPSLEEKLGRIFGFTEELREAGYILPSGRMVDFSGKNEGGSQGTRARDHREVGMATGKGRTEGMVDFICQGAIRFMPENGFLHIGKMPTEAQFRRISEIFRRYDVRGNGTIMTLQREAGVSKDFEYPVGTNPGRVMEDIRRFYRDARLASGWVSQNCRFAMEGNPLLVLKSNRRAMMTKTAWISQNCRFAAPARAAVVVAHALQSIGIRISTSKIASLMKVALPQDWNMLDDTDKGVITILVQEIYEEYRATTGRPPGHVGVDEVEALLRKLDQNHAIRVSLDDIMIQRISSYVSANWVPLTQPTGNSLSTALDTMEPEQDRVDTWSGTW